MIPPPKQHCDPQNELFCTRLARNYTLFGVGAGRVASFTNNILANTLSIPKLLTLLRTFTESRNCLLIQFKQLTCLSLPSHTPSNTRARCKALRQHFSYQAVFFAVIKPMPSPPGSYESLKLVCFNPDELITSCIPDK